MRLLVREWLSRGNNLDAGVGHCLKLFDYYCRKLPQIVLLRLTDLYPRASIRQLLEDEFLQHIGGRDRALLCCAGPRLGRGHRKG